MAGSSGRQGYDALADAGGCLVGTAEVADGRISVTDTWSADSKRVLLERRVVARAGDPVRVDLEIPIPSDQTDRFFVPGMISAPAQHSRDGRYQFADDRLGYPIVAAWNSAARVVVWLARISLASYDAAPVRELGDRTFRRDTDIGFIGFSTDRGALLAGWPVAEGDHSSQLDAAGHSFETFHGCRDDLAVTITYELASAPAPRFADAVRIATARAVELADPQPTSHSFTLEQSIDYRLDSAAKTYRETASGFAGFVLNFDPERGYDSQAKAFGASFADHEMSGSHGILEYGFTGRQLDLAHSLARRDPEEWAERGARVVDSFVQRMVHDSGWVATLFDVVEDRPLYAIGDERGPVMHYLGRFDVAGTYTRMMTEGGGDLVRNILLHENLGRDVTEWRNAAAGLAGFLLNVQNDDGSWYRGYAPDRTPIVGTDWFGEPNRTGKSATGAVVPYLLQVADMAPELASTLRDAAARAGQYIFDTFVAAAEFRGGTLDNPNDVDKEAAFIAMRALLALEAAQVPGPWRDAATDAAWFALGWHSLWPVPLVKGTPVGRAAVRSVGWGGINSVWGVGVTDIYSLFFADDLHRLGVMSGTPEFVRVAELVAHSSVEILSSPGQLHGFADTGMQPEGISFCDQGAYDGLIRKGDTWGGLGWPYTAGTTGLANYLAARAAS
ncbi:hypothetical protein QWJ90_05940 [Microbacterium oryzae]|uniref:hypothetical protein n=1 Tax=Microbacterium oryzae TaxID=743009 RepID=UPI0025B0CED8|nr:hypothetical protein [Microbacterium oryzae]MDN3310463.1 hypothetical protein [Microbacterium oryzae]